MSILNAFLAAAGGGLEYETGSFTPTANATYRTVNFAKTHTKPPAVTFCIDTTQLSTSGLNNATVWSFFDLEQLTGAAVYMGDRSYKGIVLYTEVSGTNIDAQYQALVYGSTETSQTGNYATRGFAKEASATFRTVNSQYTCNFNANRKYIWVAIWLPDSWVQPT